MWIVFAQFAFLLVSSWQVLLLLSANFVTLVSLILVEKKNVMTFMNSRPAFVSVKNYKIERKETDDHVSKTTVKLYVVY